jgi:glycosyltransferase involved in cell wall biosynthesis
MAGERPAVAVIVRTHDRAVLLRRALTDVCAQTYRDWRLVLVNDGGDAGEVDRLVAELPGLADRTTVLHNAAPRKRAGAWNQGVAASDSDYIAVHDDDDTWHPEFLARTVAHLEATPDGAVAVRTAIVWEHVEGDSVLEEGREIFFPDLHAVTLFDLLRTNRVVPIAMLYRRSVHDDIGAVREDLTVVEDWEFNLRLAAAHPIGFLDGEPLAFWHQRRAADGTLANSVIGTREDHQLMDLLVRDEALREHAHRDGLGSLLYVTSYLQREIDLMHERVTYGESRLHEIVDLLRRNEDRLIPHTELVDRQGVVLDHLSELLRRQEERLAELEQAVSDASLVSLVRRRYRRLKAALTR